MKKFDFYKKRVILKILMGDLFFRVLINLDCAS